MKLSAMESQWILLLKWHILQRNDNNHVPQLGTSNGIWQSVTANRCYRDGGNEYHCRIGRLVDGDDILPAALIPALNAQFLVFNADKHTEGEGQVLQVQFYNRSIYTKQTVFQWIDAQIVLMWLNSNWIWPHVQHVESH